MRKSTAKAGESDERQYVASKSSSIRGRVPVAFLAVALVIVIATYLALANQAPEKLADTAHNNEVEDDRDLPETDSEKAVAATPEIEKCEGPTGLTEFQAWVQLVGCEFVIWEVTQTGDVRLVSGDEEYFKSMFDDSDIVWHETEAGPDQRSGPVSGSQNSGSTTPRPAPEESYAPPPPPPPVQQPVQKMCPWERSENPAVYDACRSGFVMPSIQPVGIVSCHPANAERTSWTVKYEFALVGGSYGNTLWTGVQEYSGSRGYLTKTIDGLGEESLNGILPMGHADVEVSFGSMSPQYPGLIGIAQNFDRIQGDFSICN